MLQSHNISALYELCTAIELVKAYISCSTWALCANTIAGNRRVESALTLGRPPIMTLIIASPIWQSSDVFFELVIVSANYVATC